MESNNANSILEEALLREEAVEFMFKEQLTLYQRVRLHGLNKLEFVRNRFS
jgi:hypothetical protein